MIMIILFEINDNANFICRASKSILKDYLFICYDIWRKNIKNDIFVKYVMEVYV